MAVINKTTASEPRAALSGTGERELVITRIFDAPRALVFKAWTDPAHVKQWLGPRGFTATHLERELRPGGAWRACLRRDETGDELWRLSRDR